MHNLRSNSARLAAAALVALVALLLTVYIPSILHNITPCLSPNNCLSPYQIDVLFQRVTNATNGNIANTLAVVHEIQVEVPACPGGRPKLHEKGDEDVELSWVGNPTFLTGSINCAECWCRGGYGLSALTCVPCCQTY